MAEHIGPYEVLGELGRGGMGVVYRARHTELGREVALKVASAELQADAESRARFVREGQAAAALAHHPGIVGVHDAGEADGRLYLAMELVEGQSLADVIDAGDLTPHEAARLVAEAARAVHHAHEAGMLHRDLKPDNVMVDARGHARVTDFGLVRSAPADAQTARLTQSGMILGTPAYMPPEQATGQEADARADVYALGATLYDALTGFPPFNAESTFELIDKLLREPVEPPSRLAHGLPRDLDAITCRALAKFRGDRYPTAAALAEDLERFCAGEAVEARLPGVVERAGRAGRRNALVLGLAGAAVVAAGGAAWMWKRSGEAELSGQQRVGDARSATTAAEARTARTDRFLAVARAATEDLQLLMDAFHSVPVPEEAQAAARKRVQEQVERVAAGDAVLALGWSALADYYAGDMDGLERLHDLVAAHPEDAEIALLRLWCYSVELGEEAKAVRFSTAEGGGFGVSGDLEAFDPGAWRERVRHDIALVGAALSERPDAAGYLAFARGVDLFVAGEFAQAVTALEPAEALALQGLEASQLRAIAAMRAGDHQLAADCGERAAARGWPHSFVFAGTALLNVAAAEAARSPQQALETLGRAEALLARAIEVCPDALYLRATRATVRRILAQVARGTGGDPWPHFTGMLSDLDWERRHRPRDLSLLEQIALANEIVAREEAIRGDDPEAHAREALAACDRAAELGSLDPDLLVIRTRVQIIRVRWGRLIPARRRAVLGEALDAYAQATAGRVPGELLWGWWLPMATDRGLAMAAGPELWNRVVEASDSTSRRYLAEQPEDGNAIHGRARMLVVASFAARRFGGDAEGRLQEAREALQRLFELEPKATRGLRTLGELEVTRANGLREQRQDPTPALRAAVEAYQRASDGGYADPGFEARWAATEFDLLRFERAAGVDVAPRWHARGERLDRLLEAHPRHLGLRRVAFLCWSELQSKHPDPAARKPAGERAAAHGRLLAKAQPNDAPVAGWLGLCLARLGHNEEALTHLERALKIDPGNRDYQRTLRVVKQRLGK